MLPEVFHVSDELVAALQRYVDNGGVLLVTGASSMLDKNGRTLNDFALADLLGVHYQRETEFSVRYLDIDERYRDGVPDMPILLKAGGFYPAFGKFIDVRAEQHVEVLARFVDPEFEATLKRHVYHQHAHPSVKTDVPAIVKSARGAGQVLFTPAPIFEYYWQDNSPWLRLIADNVLAAVLPDRRLRVELPSWAAVSLMGQADRDMLHIINWHEGLPAAGTQKFVDEIQSLQGIPVSLRCGPVKRVYTTAERDRELEFTCTDGRVNVVVPQVDTHEIVVFQR